MKMVACVFTLVVMLLVFISEEFVILVKEYCSQPPTLLVAKPLVPGEPV
jgi:hypothetical protein